ncbi:MAG: PolC-type DNA polymerase III [Clostridia bacterium]|nr:PolC-type DNA polymerase III [Clostridia bacterium]
MTLNEKLQRYKPRALDAEFFDNVTSYNVLADKELRILRIEARLKRLISKALIGEIEQGIKEAYQLNSAQIMTVYPPELFGESYIPELICECERRGKIATRGFLSKHKYIYDGETLKFYIPFSESGVAYLNDDSIPVRISEVISSEFGINVSVEIHTDLDGAGEAEESRQALMNMLTQQANESARLYEEAEARAASFSGRKENEPEINPDLKRISSVFDEECEAEISEEGIVKIGNGIFDISDPEVIWGKEFKLLPVSISSVLNDKRRTVCVIGDSFNFEEKASRNGESFSITFFVSDGNASIEARMYNADEDTMKTLKGAFGKGGTIAVYGKTKLDQKNGDTLITPEGIVRIKSLSRKDTAEKKRVELHLHTQMSSMDALIPPDKAVSTAFKWGHPAVAITDHGNVQGFPEAMLAAEKLGMKVIYGMEAYFVNDMAGAVSGKYDGTFDDEFVVFDLETTGLSPRTCKIIEIGAVIIKGYEVVARYGKFVNPGFPIPQEITELTSITDDDVKDAETIDKVLPEFLEFIGDRLLIAHNASFDTSFVRQAALELGLPFNNAYLDTVSLSRFLNPELKKHTLDSLARFYELEDFHHHRAVDDAEILAAIFFKMRQLLDKYGAAKVIDINDIMGGNVSGKRQKSYHQIILVKDSVGLKNLYKLISMSYLDYYYRNPRIPKSVLIKHREGLIIGSACEAGELFEAVLENKNESEIEQIVNFYDYLEIQPICNNRFLVAEGRVEDDEALRELNRKIYALGKKYSKPVVATCDAHFLNKEDEIYRKILLTGQKFKDADRDVGIYFRTTDEMLEEFSYLGEEAAYEVVVTNTNLINDMISSDVRPIPKGTYTPNMEGAEQELEERCYVKARSLYGDPLPEIVQNRLEKELKSIISNGFAVLYMIAQKLVQYSEEQGYLVGSRGSVGSSFVASMSGISEVNPLPPHYYCPNCKHSEFFTDGSVGSGFDLPDAVCPKCGTKLVGEGHDIPFETFLGFYGDKSPDIDLNFSGEVQGRVHKYTEELFGAENVFRAGTLGTLADKTAYGYIIKYFEDRGLLLSRAEMNRMVNCCVGVKRTTGQHPGGIIVVPREYEVYDFTPVQHPADDPNSSIVTTHFAFSYLHDTILKLDELGHDIPTKYKMLEKYSNTSVMDVPMNDKNVYKLMTSTEPLGVTPEDIDANVGTYGLPELGTRFIQQVLEDAQPKNFADLLQISGLTHGTDVWLGNAQDLIKEGICDISQVIGTRDGIMLDLIRYGLDNSMAFTIMESVRKGKGLKPEWEDAMRANNVPEWYITSCKKIKYMFPKAHAAAYVMSAIRLGWYKIYIPIAFYAAMFTVAPGGFDADIVMRGRKFVYDTWKRIEEMGKEATPKEQGMISTLQLVNEYYVRGFKFLPVSLKKSDAKAFLPEDGKIRLPFSSLSGLGENAALNIIKAREEDDFFSVEDLRIRAKLTKAVIEILRNSGVLDELDETDQLSFF